MHESFINQNSLAIAELVKHTVSKTCHCLPHSYLDDNCYYCINMHDRVFICHWLVLDDSLIKIV